MHMRTSTGIPTADQPAVSSVSANPPFNRNIWLCTVTGRLSAACDLSVRQKGQHANCHSHQQHCALPANQLLPDAPGADVVSLPVASTAGCYHAGEQAHISAEPIRHQLCLHFHSCSHSPAILTAPAAVMTVRKQCPEGCRPLGDQARAEMGLLPAARSAKTLHSLTWNSARLA